MKWAVACILNSSVRSECLAITRSYQPGVFGSKKETCHVDGVLSSTCASVQETQNGVGWWIGVCADSSHLCPGSLSQRRLPMITAAAPFSMRYVSRLGATIVQRVTSGFPGPDASQSRIAKLCMLRNVFVARARIADASGGGHECGIATCHVVRWAPFTWTSTNFGAAAPATVAR